MSTEGADVAVEPTEQVRADADELRFGFGRNWAKFLELLDDERIGMARDSLKAMLGREDLAGLSVLDAGSGSGLFSLAAAQLGARNITSFDYDEQSVACTRALRQRFCPEIADWTVERGDCLDRGYVAGLGQFDIVYSWGVLHHTGAMWNAVDNLVERVAPGGTFYIALYNDQDWKSKIWTTVKRTYNRGLLGRAAVSCLFVPVLFLSGLVSDAIHRRNPVSRYTRPRVRGMSTVRDWFDWLGGYPFEVAKPEEVFYFCNERGLTLSRMRTVGGGLGCNEFVFERLLS